MKNVRFITGIALTLAYAITMFPATTYAGPSEDCAADYYGYWMVASDGGVFSFGDAQFYGSTGGMNLNKPIIGMATTPSGNGYWLVASDGGVFSFGDAPFLGSTGNIKLTADIIGIRGTSSGNGYWLFARDGGVFTFGDAEFLGTPWLGYYPYVYQVGVDADSVTSSAQEQGYWFLNPSGSIQAYGSAQWYPGIPYQNSFNPAAKYIGIARTEYSHGYWVADDKGGVYTAGGAPFHGSAGNIPLNKPIVAFVPYWYDLGYWLVASDGGVFTYGDVPFCGSTGHLTLNKPIVGASRVGFEIFDE